MTMSARYCQKCGTCMHYMNYGPPEFRCWGMACPNCESRREEARAIMYAARKKVREAKASAKNEIIAGIIKLTDEEKREAEQEAAEKLLKAIEELPEENTDG